MSGLIQGEDRTKATLFPERPDDYVAEDSPVRMIDDVIDEADLAVPYCSQVQILFMPG